MIRILWLNNNGLRVHPASGCALVTESRIVLENRRRAAGRSCGLNLKAPFVRTVCRTPRTLDDTQIETTHSLYWPLSQKDSQVRRDHPFTNRLLRPPWQTVMNHDATAAKLSVAGA
jgi:hypothetical protein